MVRLWLGYRSYRDNCILKQHVIGDKTVVVVAVVVVNVVVMVSCMFIVDVVTHFLTKKSLKIGRRILKNGIMH